MSTPIHKCPYCAETFNHKKNMPRHINKYHINEKFKIKLKINDVENNGNDNLTINKPVTNNVDINNGSITNNNGPINNTQITNINAPINNTQITNNNVNMSLPNGKDTQIYYAGDQLFGIMSMIHGEKATINKLLYQNDDITPSDVINSFIDPPNGLTPLNLIDGKTISIKINNNTEIYDTDGSALEKQTYIVLDNAYLFANKRNTSLAYQQLIEDNEKYSRLAESCKDKAEQLKYEKKAEEAHDKIFCPNKDLVHLSMFHGNRPAKTKLKVSAYKAAHQNIALQKIKKGQSIPGLKLSFKS